MVDETDIPADGCADEPVRFVDLVDVAALQRLAEDLFQALGVPVGILSPQAEVLVRAGWQDLCTMFHRVHPKSREVCLSHEMQVIEGAQPGQPAYRRCPTGLVNASLPLVLQGRQVATLAVGQFLLEDEPPDHEAFRRQARRYGFDEAEYLAALDRVPVFSREQIDHVLRYYDALVQMLAETGLARRGERQALERLRRSEQRFREVFERAVDALYLCDEQGRILEANQAACRGLGYTRAELLALRVWQVDADVTAEDYAEIWQTLLHGPSATVRSHHRRKDGTTFPVEVRVGRFASEGRQLMLAMIRDITERQQAEDELRRSEREKAMILDTMQEMFSYFDSDMRVRWANRAAAESLGLRPGQMVGHHYYALWHGRDEPCAGCPVVKAIQTGEACEGEVQTPDGRQWLLRGYPVRDEAGQVIGATELGQEITDRKRTEAALLESKRRVVEILESISDGFFDLDGEMVVTYYNQAAARLLGRPAEQVLNRPLLEAFPEARGTVFEDNYRQALREREPMAFEVYFEPFNDWYGVRVYPHGDGIAVYFQVITERKAAEEALRQAEAQLRQSQKMEAIGQLAGGVAHDFRNQLTVIKGYAELLQRRQLVAEEARPMLEEVAKAADRSAQLTDQLLTFSRKQVLQPQVVDLCGLVADLASPLARMIGEDIRLELAIGGEACQARLDPGQFQQAVMNLATNARDAMPRGGELTLAVDVFEPDDAFRQAHPDVRADPLVRLSVHDTGTGMDPQTLGHIFEPFFTTKPVGQGTGLGLAMVYGFVQQSGGAIDVQSAPGDGTTFQLYFPRAADRLVESAPAETEPGALAGQGTVLVVEDEPALRQMVARVLQGAGYTVLIASDAATADWILQGQAGPLDLLLTDVVMPGGSGVELAQRLRRHWPGMPVIFMSGYAGNDLSARGLDELGATLVPKPFTPDELLTAVRTALGP